MNCIYRVLLSKAFYYWCLSFRHTSTGTGCYAAHREQLGVRRLPQGHFDTPRAGDRTGNPPTARPPELISPRPSEIMLDFLDYVWLPAVVCEENRQFGAPAHDIIPISHCSIAAREDPSRAGAHLPGFRGPLPDGAGRLSHESEQDDGCCVHRLPWWISLTVWIDKEAAYHFWHYQAPKWISPDIPRQLFVGNR